MSKIKVIVVDDSIVFREVVTKGITSDLQIEVVAKASDPFEASEKILKYEPDVMICDIEMPKMNGIEFIKRLLPQYRIPVIVVSAASDAVFDAMDAGAVDFVPKPDIQSAVSVEKFINQMITKIRIAVQAKITSTTMESKHILSKREFDMKKVIAIGSSTGGTEALYKIFKELPSNIPGIVVVQHIPPVFSRMFAERLNKQTGLFCKEAESGDYVEPGKVIIAPGNQHMQIKKIGGSYKVEVFQGDRINGHIPSVDVLFESVAKEVSKNAVGIILTGMGYDGAKGLLSMKRKGARTIGQDEESSVVYGMPKVAYNVGAVEKQVSLTNIPQVLLSFISR